MKKILSPLVLLSVLFLSLVPVASADGPMLLYGDPGPTLKATLSDTAQTLQEAYEGAGGTWQLTANNARPIAVLISVETYPMRFSSTTTPSVDNVGHVLPVDGSMHPSNPGWMAKMKVVNAATGDNAVLQITPEY